MSKLSELRKKPHHSFSSLNGFINICSLQWAFKKVYNKEPERTPIPLLFGSSFHSAAEWVASGRMENEYAKVEEVQDVFTESWIWQCTHADKLSLSNEEFEQLNATGRKMVACLNKEWNEVDIVSISQTFSVDIGASKNLIGEIDCIVKDPQDKAILIDWKTAARKWPAGKCDRDLQATCFLFGYEQITPDFKAEENLFRYDVITKTKEPSYTQNVTTRCQDDFLRLSQLVQCVERAVNAEAFFPNEQGFYCGGCQFASACKEWHRTQAKTISIPKAA